METLIRNHFLKCFCRDNGVTLMELATAIPIDSVSIFELEQFLLNTYGASLLSSSFHKDFSLRQWVRENCPNRSLIRSDVENLIEEMNIEEDDARLLIKVFKNATTKSKSRAYCASHDFVEMLELGFIPFVIISASYNNEQNVEKYIQSIVSQRYVLFRVVYGDDASSDQTLSILHRERTRSENIAKLQNRWVLRSHASRTFQAYTKYECYQNTDDDEVLVFLDGDDHFNNPCALELVHHVYEKTNTAITFGSYCVHYNNEIVFLPNTIQPYKEPTFTICNTQPRDSRVWRHSHLRTGKAYLFKTIPKEYIQSKDGSWLTFATDVAEMYWALDQCSQHVQIHNVLVNYNKTNSIKYLNSYYNNSDHDDRRRVMEHIRLMKPAPEVLNLDTNQKHLGLVVEAQRTPFSTMLPHTYIINLERRPDRAHTMTSLCAKNGISATFFPAVDGESSAVQKAYERYLGFWAHAKNLYISRGAMGLLCTYIKLLHMCLKERRDWVCIFEDDCRFHKQFESRIQDVPRLCKQFDVVYLGANQQKWEGLRLCENGCIYEVTGERQYWTYGMFGVVLSRRAMKKMYAYLTKVPFWQHEFPIDCIMNQLIHRGVLSACVMYPNIVIADLTESDMQKSRDMNVWSKKLRWTLNDYDLIP